MPVPTVLKPIIRHHELGASLIELVISIVVLSVVVSGVMSIFIAQTTKSADPMLETQAAAIARAYMTDLMEKDYADINTIAAGPPVDQNGQAISNLAQYSVSVTVNSNAQINGVAAKKIVVNVVHSAISATQISAYRTNY